MTEPRIELTNELGDELGKSIYKQITINEKYTQHNLTYEETKLLIDSIYGKIYELLYADRYGTFKLSKQMLNKKETTK